MANGRFEPKLPLSSFQARGSQSQAAGGAAFTYFLAPVTVQGCKPSPRFFGPAAQGDPLPPLARMESDHWPRVLKEKKQPLATRKPHFRSGGRNAALASLGFGTLYVGTRVIKRRSGGNEIEIPNGRFQS
jgi:hypothetical protein